MAGDVHTSQAEGVPELEDRLAADEARLAADEQRLAADEARIEAEVTTNKLASGSVSRNAVAGAAIGTEQIEPNSVTGALVAHDTLTGADIREGSLGTVPSAKTATSAKQATSAGTAEDSARLGGLSRSAFLASVVDTRAETVLNSSSPKGPLTAHCPVGSRVISGGARIRGVVRGAAIVSNTPDAATAWTATARVVAQQRRPWQLVVTAICATGGE